MRKKMLVTGIVLFSFGCEPEAKESSLTINGEACEDEVSFVTPLRTTVDLTVRLSSYEDIELDDVIVEFVPATPISCEIVGFSEGEDSVTVGVRASSGDDPKCQLTVSAASEEKLFNSCLINYGFQLQ